MASWLLTKDGFSCSNVGIHSIWGETCSGSIVNHLMLSAFLRVDFNLRHYGLRVNDFLLLLDNYNIFGLAPQVEIC